MFDSHIHTDISSDSTMKIEDAMKRAEDLDLGLIITEHMDINFPIEGKFVFDVNSFFKKYGELRGKKLLLGIELGLREDAIEESDKMTKEYNFDYVLGSVHFVNGVDLGGESFYEGKSKKEAYTEYLKSMIKCVDKGGFFHSLGHIDYISRYATYDDKEIYYDEFKDDINEVLSILSKKDKAIEINTRRLYDKRAINNLTSIYKGFKSCGGKYVTIGSDSHKVDAIGTNMKVAFDIANYCELKPVYFKDGNMKYMEY
ncbi:MAG: histidinol phosphate phosphatase [Clostridium sp.]